MKIIFKNDDENQNMSEAKANEGASTSNLNDICYEQIKDNFYYGKFGEFRLVVDKNTGCFNATKLCIDGGKEFRKWSRLDRAKELIAFYENMHSDDDKNRRPDMAGGFYEIKTGNKDISNKKIKIRLNESLEEEDEIPPALDLKKITYLIGDHEEVIDVEKENERDFKKELKNMMRYFKDQQARGDKTDKVIIVERTELVSRLSQFVGESKTGLWNRIKELTGWKKSTMELVQSESESEESDAFKYKIMYNKTTDR
jgi:hypothetical protein